MSTQHAIAKYRNEVFALYEYDENPYATLRNSPVRDSIYIIRGELSSSFHCNTSLANNAWVGLLLSLYLHSILHSHAPFLQPVSSSLLGNFHCSESCAYTPQILKNHRSFLRTKLWGSEYSISWIPHIKYKISVILLGRRGGRNPLLPFFASLWA